MLLVSRKVDQLLHWPLEHILQFHIPFAQNSDYRSYSRL